MIDEVLFLLLGLLVAFNIGVWIAIRRCESLLTTISYDAKGLNPDDTVDALREEVGSLVQEVIGTMRPPTIADHLGGVLSQFAQMRLMKMMQSEGMLPDAVSQTIEAVSED